MSLKISDIGLDLRATVAGVKSSELYVVERLDKDPNDFNVEDHRYEVLLRVPAFGVRQLTAEQQRLMFGATNASFIRCKIATPISPFKVDQGLFGVLNYSDGVAVYKGVIERVEPKLSSLITVYINTSAVVEFDTLELGIIV